MKDINTGNGISEFKKDSADSKTKRQYPEEMFRVVINKDANACLERFWAKVNDGYQAGEISKSDIANYIFSILEKVLSDEDIATLRSLHFDEKKVLLGMLRKSDAQELPDELKQAVREYHGLILSPKKRTPRKSELSTSKAVDNESK